MTCPHCAAVLSEGATSCTACGSPLDPPAAPFEPADPTSVHGRGLPRSVLAMVGATAVLAIGVAVVAAGLLGWLGARNGGPSDALPGSAVAYLQLDLNASLAQKGQAWAFFRDLPEVADAGANGVPDPKRIVWNLVARQLLGLPPSVNYDTDVSAWLGDRVGIAILPNGTRPVVVTAVQLKEVTSGTQKLNEWFAGDKAGYTVMIRDHYAVVFATASAEVVRDGFAHGVLSHSHQFTGDFGALGDPGLMAGWAELAELSRLAPENTSSLLTGVQGRAVLTLRFSTDVMELVGSTVGSEARPAVTVGDLGELPATTGAALSLSDGAAMLTSYLSGFSEVERQQASSHRVEQDDLRAALGGSFAVFVPTGWLDFGSLARPMFAVRTVSDDPVRARESLRRVNRWLFRSALVADRIDGDVLTAAAGKNYLGELAQPSPKLSSSATFVTAVPDHAKATVSFYANVVPSLRYTVDARSAYHRFVTALRAIGGQYVVDGSGKQDWRIRLVRE